MFFTISASIKALLKIYPTKIGGRKTPIASGYRPNHVFEYKNSSKEIKETFIGEITFENPDLIKPSEESKRKAKRWFDETPKSGNI